MTTPFEPRDAGARIATRCKDDSRRTGPMPAQILFERAYLKEPAMTSVKALWPNALSLEVHHAFPAQLSVAA